MTDEERIGRCNQKQDVAELKERKPDKSLLTAMECAGVTLLPNTICPQINHVKVLQQSFGDKLRCGFYMYNYSKLIAKAILA